MAYEHDDLLTLRSAVGDGIVGPAIAGFGLRDAIRRSMRGWT